MGTISTRSVALIALMIAAVATTIFATGNSSVDKRLSRLKSDRVSLSQSVSEHRDDARESRAPKELLDVHHHVDVDPKSATPYSSDTLSSPLAERRSNPEVLGGQSALSSPGLDIGTTYWDIQHNHTQGAEIVRSPGSDFVHFMYAYADAAPTDVSTAQRFVNYSVYQLSTSMLVEGYGGVTLDPRPLRSGFPVVDVDQNGLFRAAIHRFADIGINDFVVTHLQFPLPGLPVYSETELSSFNASESIDYGELTWPRLSVQQNSILNGQSGTDIDHVIARESNNKDRIIYWRYNGSSWEGPVAVDSNFSYGYVLASDPNSDRCAIALHADRIDEMLANGNPNTAGLVQIAYYESTTEGAGWINGTELGSSSKSVITSYESYDGPQAWLHISAMYDNSSRLHIVFDEQRYANSSEQVAIRHWNSVRNTLRRVVNGYYSNGGVTLYNLNLAKMTMGIGDGSTPCQAGAETNDDYLYVLYTKFGGESSSEQADTSAQGYANGELYLTVSRDHGDSWSVPENLTGTKTPDCDPGTPGQECASENWASIGRFVAPDIDISYILDVDAGAAPFGEGTWALNKVMYLRLAGGTTDAAHLCPNVEPVMSIDLQTDSVCEFHAAPGGVVNTVLTISNSGNAPLSGSAAIASGATWLTLNGSGTPVGFNLPAGDNAIAINLNMNAVALSEGLYRDSIRIIHDDPNQTSPTYVPIDFFVFQDFICPEYQYLKTGVASPGVLSLLVSSTSRLAAGTAEGGLWRHADSSSSLYDASLLIARPPMGIDTVVWHDLYSRADPGNRGLRALTPLDTDTMTYTTGAGYATAKSSLTTADSSVGVDIEYFFPQSLDSSDFVIARYQFYNRTASPITNLTIGQFFDLDVLPALHLRLVQSGQTNSAHWDALSNTLYFQGQDTTGHIPDNPDHTATRYSGGVTFLEGVPFDRIYVGSLADDFTSNDGPSSGLLYRELIDAGSLDFSADDEDIYAILRFFGTITLNPDDTLCAAVAILSDTVHPFELFTSAYGARNFAANNDLVCPREVVAAFNVDQRCGTAPLTVEVTDVSYADQGIATWEWDFGDGTMSTEQFPPPHEYTIIGIYDLQLIVSDGLRKDTSKTFVIVGDVADFAAHPLTGLAPLHVEFGTSGFFPSNSVFWSFGDSDTSVAFQPTHEYNTPGIYEVKFRYALDVDTVCQFVDSLVRADYIVVKSSLADFDASPTAGFVPFSVQFNDLSSGVPESWEWDFGDETTSMEQHPNHEYTTPGIYDVRLIVSGAGLTDTIVKTQYVIANDVNAVDLVVNASANKMKPGFDFSFWPEWTNEGAQTAENCTLWVVLPADVAFLDVNDAIGYYGSASYVDHVFRNDTVIIRLTDVAPSSVPGGYLPIELSLDVGAECDAELGFETWISTTSSEFDILDNRLDWTGPVVCSNDPNDKSANPTGNGPNKAIAPDQSLTFRVDFENKATASDSATYILVLDTLDPKLNWSSVKAGPSSHPGACSFNFNPANGVITYYCKDIMLPPNQSPPEGEGYFTFSVAPDSGLTDGDSITNRAYIQFDFNPFIAAPGSGPLVRTISTCDCPCHADPACDAAIDVFDVVAGVDVAFRSVPSTFDPLCPNAQTDVNCDDITDVFDVVSLVDVAFRSGDPGQFCDPCGGL